MHERLKDNLFFENAGKFYSSYDATGVARLKQDDAIVVGKTNLDRFAMGSSTENSAFYYKNPWDLEREGRGSSGGSAASVAADECIFALGSGYRWVYSSAISCCGVVGLNLPMEGFHATGWQKWLLHWIRLA